MGCWMGCWDDEITSDEMDHSRKFSYVKRTSNIFAEASWKLSYDMCLCFQISTNRSQNVRKLRDSSFLTKAEEILTLSDKDLGLPCVYR